MDTCEACQLPVLRLIFEGRPIYVDPYIRTFAPIVPPERLAEAAQDGDTAWRSGARVEHSAVCKGKGRGGVRKPKETPHA